MTPKRRTPESRYSHRDGSISFNLFLPQTQNYRNLPDATPKGGPGSSSGLLAQPN
jgi:hypothetical protein